MEAPVIKAVEFKNPTTQRLVVGSLVVTRESLTKEVYLKLLKISPQYADQFNVIFDEQTEEVETPNENTND